MSERLFTILDRLAEVVKASGRPAAGGREKRVTMRSYVLAEARKACLAEARSAKAGGVPLLA